MLLGRSHSCRGAAVVLFLLLPLSVGPALAQTKEDGCYAATPEQPGPQDAGRVGAALNNFWKLDVKLLICSEKFAGVASSSPDGRVFFHNAKEITVFPTRKQQVFSVWFLLAHEWGHQVQYRTYAPGALDRSHAVDPPVLELQADCLAGFTLGTFVSRGVEIPFAMNAVTWELGDTGGPNSHGNLLQRQAAFSRGLAGTGYPANQTVGAAPGPRQQSWQTACDPRYFRHGIRENAEMWHRWISPTEWQKIEAK